MRLTVLAEEIRDAGRACGDPAALLLFAVEDAERIAVETVAAGGAHVGKIGADIFLQSGVVSLPALPAPYAVDVEGEGGQPHRSEEGVRERDDLGVRRGQLAAVELHAELMVFAQPPVLGAFIAEDGREIISLHGEGLLREPVLDESARDTRRPLGAQSHAPATLVEEGVHLFGHDVRGLPHAAREEFGVLEHGGADLAEAEERGDFPRLFFDVMPFVGVRREHILGAFGDVDHVSSARLLPSRIPPQTHFIACF